MVVVLALAGIAARAGAQERNEPRLVISLFGGLTTTTSLWEIPRQPVLVLGTELSPVYDTLRLTRRMNPGLILGISGTVFQSARFGFSAEMIFLGLTTDDDCSMVRESAADPLHRNAQICGDISGGSTNPTTVGFFLGGVFRPLPRAAFSPYAQIRAGIGLRSSSVIEMVGSFATSGGTQQRLVIGDPSPARLVPSAGLAGGFMVPLGTGYQLRLEIRDQIMAMRRVAGPANPLAQGETPTEGFLFHSIGLTAGLDIVLEQRRGRRY